MVKKSKYEEGQQARENFEKLATELFKVPKTAVSTPTRKRQPKKATSQKKGLPPFILSASSLRSGQVS